MHAVRHHYAFLHFNKVTVARSSVEGAAVWKENVAVKFKSLYSMCTTHALPDDGLGQDFRRSQTQALNTHAKMPASVWAVIILIMLLHEKSECFLNIFKRTRNLLWSHEPLCVFFFFFLYKHRHWRLLPKKSKITGNITMSMITHFFLC